LETSYQCAWTLNLFLSGFISSLPQLAWEKRLCCCCCITWPLPLFLLLSHHLSTFLRCWPYSFLLLIICLTMPGLYRGDFDLNNAEDGVLSSAFMVGLLVASLIFASLAKRLALSLFFYLFNILSYSWMLNSLCNFGGITCTYARLLLLKWIYINLNSKLY